MTTCSDRRSSTIFCGASTYFGKSDEVRGKLSLQKNKQADNKRQIMWMFLDTEFGTYRHRIWGSCRTDVSVYENRQLQAFLPISMTIEESQVHKQEFRFILVGYA